VDVRAVVAHAGHFLHLLFVRTDDGDGAGVVEDVFDLPAEERGVDGNGDGSAGEDGEIGNRPLRAILGKDGYAVAGFESEKAQAGGEVADGVAELVDAGVDPLAVPFVFQRRRTWQRASDAVDVIESLDLHPRGPLFVR